MPSFSQSRSNATAAGYDPRQGGGGKAGEHHKTSIDALLNPKHAGAQPYRLVLGDVRATHALLKCLRPMGKSNARFLSQSILDTIRISATQSPANTHSRDTLTCIGKASSQPHDKHGSPAIRQPEAPRHARVARA